MTKRTVPLVMIFFSFSRRTAYITQYIWRTNRYLHLEYYYLSLLFFRGGGHSIRRMIFDGKIDHNFQCNFIKNFNKFKLVCAGSRRVTSYLMITIWAGIACVYSVWMHNGPNETKCWLDPDDHSYFYKSKSVWHHSSTFRGHWKIFTLRPSYTKLFLVLDGLLTHFRRVEIRKLFFSSVYQQKQPSGKSLLGGF